MSRRTSALDRTVIRTPGLALASATRELLRMGEAVEVMPRPVMDFFDAATTDQIRRTQKLDDEVRCARTEIRLYIAEVNRGSMTAAEAQRGIELTDFAINLERAGDIVAKNLLVLTQELRDKDLRFHATAGANWPGFTAVSWPRCSLRSTCWCRVISIRRGNSSSRRRGCVGWNA